MSPAMQTAEEHAAPPTAAGARLQQIRRQVRPGRLGRVGMWAAVAARPLAPAAAVAVIRAAPTTKATMPADPSGYATLILRASAGAENTAQTRLTQSTAPDADLPQTTAAQPEPDSVVAVCSAQHTGTAWSVTVAVSTVIELPTSGRFDVK